MSSPLVSIGIPTYNRPHGLQRTLESITNQTYRNIEIIISDNCSDNSQVLEVIESFRSIDARIKAFHQTQNIGAISNFQFVLTKSTGEYFMWASDDDIWDSSFINELASYLEINTNIVLIMSEAQYISPEGKRLPFFQEGRGFYENCNKSSSLHRLMKVVHHNYGNLGYGIYRRSVLFNENSELIFCANEIPLLLQVASKGCIQVIDKILFYKTINFSAYLSTARERGFYPFFDGTINEELKLGDLNKKINIINELKAIKSNIIQYISNSKLILIYHIRAWEDIKRTMCILEKINLITKIIISISLLITLSAHYFKLVIVWASQDTIIAIRKRFETQRNCNRNGF